LETEVKIKLPGEIINIETGCFVIPPIALIYERYKIARGQYSAFPNTDPLNYSPFLIKRIFYYYIIKLKPRMTYHQLRGR
jgi:hypothetical protein